MHKLDAFLKKLHDCLYYEGLPPFQIGDKVEKLQKILSELGWMIHELRDADVIDNKEEQTLVDTHTEAKTEFERFLKLKHDAIAICKSFECYTAFHTPENEWDEYDQMMFPLWKALVETLGIDPKINK